MALEETANSVALISTRKISESPPQPDAGRTSEDVIREWAARFATNCGQALSEARVLLWVDELSDIEPARLELAFRSVMRSHVFNSIPQVGEIRGRIEHAQSNAAGEEAAQKFDRVLAYAIRRSPDVPDRNPLRISEHTRRAIAAAGGLDYLRDCDRESLQWARKRFSEAYLRYGELQKGEYLLPTGEVRDLLEACAERKQLPGADAYETNRAIGESYRERLAEYSAEVRQLQATVKSGRLWQSDEDRQQALASLGQHETDPVIIDRIRAHKAALAAKGFVVCRPTQQERTGAIEGGLP